VNAREQALAARARLIHCRTARLWERTPAGSESARFDFALPDRGGLMSLALFVSPT
jgi:hypothetical protein